MSKKLLANNFYLATIFFLTSCTLLGNKPNNDLDYNLAIDKTKDLILNPPKDTIGWITAILSIIVIISIVSFSLAAKRWLTKNEESSKINKLLFLLGETKK